MNAIVEQRTDAWFEARLGKVTASRLNDVMATLKSGGEAASRRNYKADLVAERRSGAKLDGFTSAAMKWGTDAEPLARAAYEAETGTFVTEVGFIDHPAIPMTGASPDGLVGDHGLIEIKCPNTATHIDWLRVGAPPAEYMNQMSWQMECTGRKWCDFVSFDPRLDPDAQLFIVRYHRDEQRIQALRDEVQRFLAEVLDMEKEFAAAVERMLMQRRTPKLNEEDGEPE